MGTLYCPDCSSPNTVTEGGRLHCLNCGEINDEYITRREQHRSRFGGESE